MKIINEVVAFDEARGFFVDVKTNGALSGLRRLLKSCFGVTFESISKSGRDTGERAEVMDAAADIGGGSLQFGKLLEAQVVDVADKADTAGLFSFKPKGQLHHPIARAGRKLIEKLGLTVDSGQVCVAWRQDGQTLYATGVDLLCRDSRQKAVIVEIKLTKFTDAAYRRDPTSIAHQYQLCATRMMYDQTFPNDQTVAAYILSLSKSGSHCYPLDLKLWLGARKMCETMAMRCQRKKKRRYEAAAKKREKKKRQKADSKQERVEEE